MQQMLLCVCVCVCVASVDRKTMKRAETNMMCHGFLLREVRHHSNDYVTHQSFKYTHTPTHTHAHTHTDCMHITIHRNKTSLQVLSLSQQWHTPADVNFVFLCTHFTLHTHTWSQHPGDGGHPERSGVTRWKETKREREREREMT